MKTQYEDPLVYYAQHSLISNPGKFLQQFANLSLEIAELCQIVQGFLLHIYWAEKYGVTPPETRRAESGIRHVENMLARGLEIDPSPLSKTRSLEKRLIVNCRSFSVLLCALLRSQGVPSRTRCGFANYFVAGRHEDHWVCEYWDRARQRWILADAQLDELQCQALQIPFNPLDVPRDQILVGGQAWQLCRSQQADPQTFGIFDMSGLWFVRGNLVRDIAALNKMPLLPWDGWGLIEGQDEDISPKDLAFLDQIATASVADIDYPTIRALYTSDPRLRVPEMIRSYTNGGVLNIEVATEMPLNPTPPGG
jgi:hypothetical protein